MNIKPIKTEQDYEEALRQVSDLMLAQPDTPAGDLLDVLGTLIDAYEARHYPIDLPDPIEAVKFRLQQENLTRKDLESILKVRRGRVSELLTKKRPLTLKMMRTLHDELGVPAETLLKKYSLRKDHHPPS